MYPLEVLQRGIFREGDIEILLENSPVKVPSDIIRLIDKYAHIWEEQGFYDEFRIGSVREIILTRRGSSEDPFVILKLQPTGYFHFLATNANLNLRKDFYEKDRVILQTRAKQLKDPFNPIRDFANPLSVNTIVLCDKGTKTIIVKRSSRTCFRDGLWYPSAAETFSIPHDTSEDGRPSIFSTIKRGVHEEIGIIQEDITDYYISGLFFDWEVYDYKFSAIVDTALSCEDIIGRWKLLAKDSKYEGISVNIVPFEVKTLLNAQGWAPELRASFIMGLVSKYGPARIKRELEKLIL
ncbi:hypothetical protein [Thermococcus sp. ES12]|uniref:hypothetical protein n=1 Tax=Thermococcus sp. ES12 TaxID=1638246 RepID=UPI001431E4F5|nr:hypothetical protein [Thermococcus sp. ES12]NJE75384.1 hypothetical protein [Thermococcus sp. ES12]